MDIKIQIDPEREPALYDRLRSASKTLEEIVGPQAARFVKEVEWSEFEDSGPLGPKHAVRLKMIDPFAGTKEETFQPVELRSPGYMKTRLREVWGEFLRQLSDEQMERIDHMVNALEGD